MTDIVKRNARAILLDGDELVLIKRTKPGREPYWVSVGGGVEDDDPTIEAALHREVFEELGGKPPRWPIPWPSGGRVARDLPDRGVNAGQCAVTAKDLD